MSEIFVNVKDLSKCFYIFKSERTTLRILKSLLKGETLKYKFWSLRDVSFRIQKGEKLAIIGKNGCGKTTLLRIISGIYDKTSGRVIGSSLIFPVNSVI